jgi:hypothetical protein
MDLLASTTMWDGREDNGGGMPIARPCMLMNRVNQLGVGP